jgi:hypothetical protein
MRSLFIAILTSAILSCVGSNSGNHALKKLEIIRIDSTRDHFVFKTKDELGKEVIVLAEKDKVSGCRPFRKYIIVDSIHQVSAIKSGKRYDLVGFYLSTIDSVRIRSEGELVKIIWNCDCFTD